MKQSHFQAIAVIPAAGVGQRMAAEVPKQYLECYAKPLIWHCLNVFQHCQWIEQIYVPLSVDDSYWSELIGEQFDKVITLSGGASRADSVKNGLALAQQHYNDQTWVLVHDAARPCLFAEDLANIKATLLNDKIDGLILADKINDTVKKSEQGNRITTTLDRSHLWRALTPQVFQLGALFNTLSQLQLDKITDEASAMEAVGSEVQLLQGDIRNIKVTRPADLKLAEIFLASEFKQ